MDENQEQKSEKDDIMAILKGVRELTREKINFYKNKKKLEKELEQNQDNNDNWGGGMSP